MKQKSSKNNSFDNSNPHILLTNPLNYTMINPEVNFNDSPSVGELGSGIIGFNSGAIAFSNRPLAFQHLYT